jgi:hypothetical protein
MRKKNIWASFQRIVEPFTQKFVSNLSKIWVWDPGSGVKKAPDRIRNTDRSVLDPHWFQAESGSG